MSSGKLATPGTARDTGVGHGSSWHADDIDKQRASAPIGRRSAFENARVVCQIITGKLGVAKFYDQVRYVVSTKNRERRIRIILKEAVLSMTPQRNEPAGLHMPGHARRTPYQPVLTGRKRGLAIHTSIRVA